MYGVVKSIKLFLKFLGAKLPLGKCQGVEEIFI
jgi:hypothetical protein